MWMNEYDIKEAVRRFGEETPNLQRGAQVLSNLMDWTNNNSDGWPYWQKPSRAAAKLMDRVQSAIGSRPSTIADITTAELTAALSPIKAFLTREGVDHSKILS